jgi:hypothetical protein
MTTELYQPKSTEMVQNILVEATNITSAEESLVVQSKTSCGESGAS